MSEEKNTFHQDNCTYEKIKFPGKYNDKKNKIKQIKNEILTLSEKEKKKEWCYEKRLCEHDLINISA